jgi:hypothetical protein
MFNFTLSSITPNHRANAYSCFAIDVNLVTLVAVVNLGLSPGGLIGYCST